METPGLAVLVLAMAAFEGNRGDRNWRNNNPCNLRYAGQRHTTGHDIQHFAQFDTIEHGFDAAERQILIDLSRRPNLTFAQLINLWAPQEDGNNHNDEYAAFVAHAFGLQPNDTLQAALDLL